MYAYMLRGNTFLSLICNNYKKKILNESTHSIIKLVALII